MSPARSVGALALCLLLAGAAPAQPPGLPIRLALRPAAAPKPALRYRLLPELRETTPGNAVDLYKQAVKLVQQLAADPAERGRPDELEKWAATPARDLPRECVREALDKYNEVLDLTDKAARCERCDWGLTEQLRQAGFGAVLPEHAYLRDLARLLAVRARLEVADGQPEAALRTLQTGLAMGRHAGDCPSLVCYLIGHGIGQVMARQLDAVVEAHGVPNLYWALADLPWPYIDVRRPLEGDRLMFLATFPGLAEAARDPAGAPLAPADLRKAVAALLRDVRQERGFRGRRALALEVSKRHEAAKRALVAQGAPAEVVEKRPHVEVALLHGFAEYQQRFDEAGKWHDLPFWEAWPHLRGEADWLRKARGRPAAGPALPLAAVYLPRVARLVVARATLQRKLAALRCVEALRLHAAARGGQLPRALADLQEVPVPADPMTGRPFEYRLEGGKATLHAPPPDGEKPVQHNTFTYELTLTR
jgi:hypothetical protein